MIGINHARTRYRILRLRGHNWLVRHPRLWHWLHVTGCLRSGPEAAARGVAVGLFIGLTPTVGFQMVLMFVASMVFRANFPVAFAVSWLSNPLTMGPLYWAFHQIGKLLYTFVPFVRDPVPPWMLEEPAETMFFTLMGSLLVAVPFAIGGYLFSHALHRFILLRRRARRTVRDAAHDTAP